MKNIQPENIAEHCQQTALIAHALALVENRIFGKNLDTGMIGMMAVFHESAEVITGDMPTPVKYFSDEIVMAYKKVESYAEDKLLKMLPPEFLPDITALVKPDKTSYEFKLVKCADKLAAYIKCIEELRSHNNEFRSAEVATKAALDELSKEVPSVEYFFDNFIQAYHKNLDELL